VSPSASWASSRAPHSGCSPEAGKVAIDENSIFEIGSITKGFTGIILADMVLKGEVSLDDPASKYSRPGAKLPSYGGREITLRHLVTHTSSLPRLPPGFRPTNLRDPYSTFDGDALYEALARTQLTRDIGSSNEYSNFGFMWLSEMLARRAGKSYEALLLERIAVPLGMTSTFVAVPPAIQSRFVTGHDTFYQPVPHWEIPGDLAGVGLVRSSLADMMRLAEALAGRRSTPLDQAIALAVTPLHRLGDPSLNIGYAWSMRDRESRRTYNHGGGTGGFASMIVFEREKKTAAVVLVDANTRFDDLALHLVDPDFPLARKRVALVTDATLRQQYVGNYELRPNFVITVFEDGDRLMARATGQSAAEVFRQGTDSFAYRVVDARLAFTRDKEGKVDGLVLHQAGRQLPAKRVASP
jgi:CubicO group peptidase (beta-lactamase class C family)